MLYRASYRMFATLYICMSVSYANIFQDDGKNIIGKNKQKQRATFFAKRLPDAYKILKKRSKPLSLLFQLTIFLCVFALRGHCMGRTWFSFHHKNRGFF